MAATSLDIQEELNNLSTRELEAIEERGENLHIPDSRASIAKRILEKRRHLEILKRVKPEHASKKNRTTESVIFYSWQSDLVNSANRSLIERALERAVKNIRDDLSILAAPRVDRDTANIPGSPNIPSAILKKIDKSSVFVADVTIINKGSKFKKTPNPNVIFETGYAMKSLTEGKILLVQNLFYGPSEQLPFDLDKNRVIGYYCDPEDDKKQIRTELQKGLEYHLKLILDSNNKKIEGREQNQVEDIQKSEKPRFPTAIKVVTDFDYKEKKRNILDNFRRDIESFIYAHGTSSSAHLQAEVEYKRIADKELRDLEQKYMRSEKAYGLYLDEINEYWNDEEEKLKNDFARRGLHGSGIMYEELGKLGKKRKRDIDRLNLKFDK